MRRRKCLRVRLCLGLVVIYSYPMTLELVVARYNEDLRWLRRVPRPFRITVYNKGSDEVPINHQPLTINHLRNIGREAHTYLHHIVTRYDDLADLTVFCQGKPFDHVPDFHRVLRRLAKGKLEVKGFLWLGFIIDRDDRTGSLLFQKWGKNPEGRPLPMDEVWTQVWPGPVPAEFTFYPSGHFVVSAEQRSKQWLASGTLSLTASAF